MTPTFTHPSSWQNSAPDSNMHENVGREKRELKGIGERERSQNKIEGRERSGKERRVTER